MSLFNKGRKRYHELNKELERLSAKDSEGYFRLARTLDEMGQQYADRFKRLEEYLGIEYHTPCRQPYYRKKPTE